MQPPRIDERAAVFSSFGCCQRQELNRANPADAGVSDAAVSVDGVACDAAAVGPVADPVSPPVATPVSSLKLYANCLLQRAECAHFFRGDQCQGAPG